MDDPMRNALEQYLLALDGPVELGPRRDVRGSDAMTLEQRGAQRRPPLESLMLKRQSMIEMHGWQTAVPFVVIIALAIAGVVLVIPHGTTAAVGVAIGSSIAVLFRLMQVAERLQNRRMIFALIQLSRRSKGCQTDELVRLLLASQKFKFASDDTTVKPQESAP